MNRLHALLRVAALLAAGAGLLATAGCTAAGALITVVGVSTDTSITWDLVKYAHQQLTEGDDRPCAMLNSAQRAVAARCGPFRPGSIARADIGRTGYAECELTLATRDPALWPAVPELLEKGARLDACTDSPLVALARRDACPMFENAPDGTLSAFETMALADPRAVQHDAMRMLTCPHARAAGLDRVVEAWRVSGALRRGTVAFGPLGALHPDALVSSPLAAALEADGHRARDALGGYQGTLRPGFEEALRSSHWTALQWWLAREPSLAKEVPPTQGNQLTWIPLQRVLLPNFLDRPDTQKDMVAFLLARGASPQQRLPSNPSQTVLAFARLLKSPAAGLMEPPPEDAIGAPRVAAATRPAPPGE